MTAPDPMPLVERLRKTAHAMEWGYATSADNVPLPDVLRKVADEIERLTAALEAEKAEVFRLQASHSALYASVEALRDALAQEKGVPEGWVPLRIEHEPGYPEDVAFGPQRMMDRLKKWLDKYFAGIVAARNREPLPLPPMRASIFKHPELGDLYDTLAVHMYAAGYAEDTMAAMLAATPPSPAQAAGWRDIESAPRDGWKLVPVEATPAMVDAYLKANDAYWRATDEIPPRPDVWRTGTPKEATAASYRAMLAAAPGHPPSEQPINQQV